MGSTGVRPIGACERGVVNGTFSRKSFSSKTALCNATTERGDGLYSAYCPLPSDEARQQNAAFHEKGKVFATKQINSLKIIFNFGQYEKINDHIDRSTGLLDDRIGGGGTEKRIQGRRDT